MEIKKTAVLIVSSSVKFYNAVCSFEETRDIYDFSLASDMTDAKRKLLTAEFSVVMINAPLSDGFGLELATEIAASSPAGVMIFTAKELYDKVRSRSEPYGIVTMPKQTTPAAVKQALTLLTATANRFRSYQKRNDELKSEMEELKLTNRAKLLLMERFGMTEDEAHRYITKRAMDTSEPKTKIAENIINSYAN